MKIESVQSLREQLSALRLKYGNYGGPMGELFDLAYKMAHALNAAHSTEEGTSAYWKEQARLWEHRCHEEEKNATQHYTDLMALKYPPSSTEEVASSDTPRTDAAVNVAHSDGYSLCEPQVVHASFARQLERELAEERKLRRDQVSSLLATERNLEAELTGQKRRV